MEIERLIENLREKGFGQEQINQLVKFHKEGFKFIDSIEPNVSATNIRNLRKIYGTKKISGIDFSNYVKKVNENLNIFKFFDENYETKYKSQQINVLCSCMKYNEKNSVKDFSKLENCDFSTEQMCLLKEAIIAGITEEKLFNPEIPINNMKIIIGALKNGVNDKNFYNPIYMEKQLEALINIKANGFDVDLLASPHLDDKTIKILEKAIYKKIDISKFNNGQYDSQECELFIKALENKYDIDLLLKEEYSFAQKLEIYYGLESGIDIKKYSDPRFNASQMNIIRQGLEKGLNIEPLLNHKFTSKRMQLILYNIKHDREYKIYLDPDISENEADAIESLIKKGYTILAPDKTLDEKIDKYKNIER